METYIDECLATGIIHPSSSPAGTGFFFVEKKDKSLRLCIDYRGLNDILVKGWNPLPPLSAFELLEWATIFMKLDLHNAHPLVLFHDGDKWKTNLNASTVHQYFYYSSTIVEYLVIPFGHTSAPAVLQALINDMLKDMMNNHVFAYLDDILIFSRTKEEHIHHMLLHQLLGYGMREHPDGPQQIFCRHHQGHPRLLQTTAKIPVVHQLLLEVHQAIPQPSAQAFQVTLAPILEKPDTERQFVMEVYASNIEVGAAVFQWAVSEQHLHPCAFVFRPLTLRERNYNIMNQELLTIKLGVEEWRHWLKGTKIPFLVCFSSVYLQYQFLIY